MIIKLLSKGKALIGCDDRVRLEMLQVLLDGSKVRMKNQIIIPVKSLPKLLPKHNEDIWDDGALNLAYLIHNNCIVREQNIKKIKEQYGKEIKFDYEVDGIFSPLKHQRVIYNCIYYNDVANISADPGTCKTAPYLWAINQRVRKNQNFRAMVITLACLKKNVLEEMKKQTPNLKGIVLDGKAQSEKVFKKLYKDPKKNIDYNVYLANYESMFSLVDLFDDNFFDMVVLDEAHRIGNPTSRQTKAIIDKFESTKYKYTVTGSLHSNNILSFYCPFRFLGPDTVPVANYNEMRRLYMFPVDPDCHVWIAAPGSEAKVQEIVGKISVNFKKEDCLDLPPIIHEKISCDMDPDQKKIYDEMKVEFVTTVKDMCDKCDKKGSCDMSCEESIKARSALVLLGKLKQIASGFYINTRYKIDEITKKETNISNIITLDKNPKMDLLMQVLTTIPGDKKTIIWSDYIHAIDMIYDRISNAYGKDCCLKCYKDDDSFKQVERFQNPKVFFMVANPSKMGVGLNIQFSNYQVFYSNSYSYIQRSQAEGRQHRQGQLEKVTVFDLIVSGTIDEIVLAKLLDKKDMAVSLSQLANVL